MKLVDIYMNIIVNNIMNLTTNIHSNHDDGWCGCGSDTEVQRRRQSVATSTTSPNLEGNAEEVLPESRLPGFLFILSSTSANGGQRRWSYT